jgi:hypothetical protein
VRRLWLRSTGNQLSVVSHQPVEFNLVRGEHVITGFRHLDIKRQLPRLSSSQISRHLKRLRVHGLVKRIGRHYKYYATELGRRAIITGLKLRELFVLPQLASTTH